MMNIFMRTLISGIVPISFYQKGFWRFNFRAWRLCRFPSMPSVKCLRFFALRTCTRLMRTLLSSRYQQRRIRSECRRFPSKNLSNFNFTLEVEAISNESFSGRPYDIITQNFVNCQANTQFFVNLQLKENMSYKGNMPAKDFIRKILVLKIKGSSIYYNYPIEVFVFESTNSNGMS